MFLFRLCGATASLLGLAVALAAAEAPRTEIRRFFEAAGPDERQADEAVRALAQGWRESDAALLLDLLRVVGAASGASASGPDLDPGQAQTRGGGSGTSAHPGLPHVATARVPGAGPRDADSPAARIRQRLLRLLARETGQPWGADLRAWRHWLWSRPADPHPDYALFKAALYAQVDPRLADLWGPGPPPAIRLDEIDWAGVDGASLSPLDHPRVLRAADARFLKDAHVVFGMMRGGEARAYPRRIVSGHAVVRDRLGGEEIALVHGALSGLTVAYASEVAGQRRTFSPSGLLYRSTMLLVDAESRSLWTSLDGRPVMGPQAGAGLALRALPVVATTWAEWRAAHPETTVLSLDTGFRRDYAEGAAYREYLSTDRLSFEVPQPDARLPNKAAVLGLLLAPASGPPQALAVAAALLKHEPVKRLTLAGHDLVVITSAAGAHRAYEAGGVAFATGRAEDRVDDAEGRSWTITEDALLPTVAGPPPRPRVPARSAFWFAWHALVPDTELVK